ncbi:MAG: Hsp20/alpha crystallin family protein [Eubacteriales bacterium]|nr:Hsp20/alpha crystallin family protein [Eubacteriales bacterium]
MLMPSIFGENLFDDFFDDFPFFDDREMRNTEKKLYGNRASHIMKADVKELDDGYELILDLPGFTKDEISASLENGYLTITAEKALNRDQKDKEEKNGKYIRKERYSGTCSRSFYVGEQVTQDEIKAEFKHGLLTMHIPKKEDRKVIPERKQIAIAG